MEREKKIKIYLKTVENKQLRIEKRSGRNQDGAEVIKEVENQEKGRKDNMNKKYKKKEKEK